MNLCPYAHESATCSLQSPEVDGTTAYCNYCSRLLFGVLRGTGTVRLRAIARSVAKN